MLGLGLPHHVGFGDRSTVAIEKHTFAGKIHWDTSRLFVVQHAQLRLSWQNIGRWIWSTTLSGQNPKVFEENGKTQVQQSKSHTAMWKVMVYEIAGLCSKRFILFHAFYTWSFQTSGFHLTRNVFVAAPIPSQNMFNTFSIVPLPDGYNIIYHMYPYISCRVFIVLLDLTFQFLSFHGVLNATGPWICRRISLLGWTSSSVLMDGRFATRRRWPWDGG